MNFEVLCDDATGILIVGLPSKVLDVEIVDRPNSDLDEVLVRLDLRHATNTNREIVLARDKDLIDRVLPTIRGLKVYEISGVPGERGSQVEIFTNGVLAIASLSFYIGYDGRVGVVRVSLKGDVGGGLDGLGVLRVARVASAGLLSGYPHAEALSPNESVFRIQNRSRATVASNHVEIGTRGDGCTRLIGAVCHDSEGNERMRASGEGCVFNGNTNTRLGVGESLTVHSMVSGSDVYSVDATGNVFATSYTSLSDARMKCNITRLRRRNCLRDINKLECYSYNFCVGDALLHHGLLANEVAKVIPSIVRGGLNGHVHHVAYDELIPFLVGAVQTLHQRIVRMMAVLFIVTLGTVVGFFLHRRNTIGCL
jgi:hypothetical protein